MTPAGVLFHGRVSTFGGPHDTGMGLAEGLALVHLVGQRPQVFPEGSSPREVARGRGLNPDALYLACPWNYHVTPPGWLLAHQLLVTAQRTGRSVLVWPVDWGPAPRTGRIADLSPGATKELGVDTGDVVTVEVPR